MLYFINHNCKTEVFNKFSDIPIELRSKILSSWDFETMSHAESIAEHANLAGKEKYMAIDRGVGVSPQYDIIKMPQIGDLVSKTFNGDYYPCGSITKISPTLRITTSLGEKFSYKNGGWHSVSSRCWCLVVGVIDERNPQF